MKKTLGLLFLILLFISGGCSSPEIHFLKDADYRDQVHQQFLKRKENVALREKDLFSVFERQDLSIEQREALEFLYAYMPLSDLADYDGDFFLGQVDAAFMAREYFSWGKNIPDDIFRHFVLVYRVNNEDLDSARQVFFDELKDRVKGLSMEQAVLEVNHWCHEKVTYRGTDGRTSAPLALARTSWGRCGEESTFTTMALRAVGIPARQCYTPRWVHTDDNHAWVEAWVDGKWHYIGACEPEPELDVAWFTGPAKRAMMVHTNVFGAYKGSEEKNVQTDLYSIINLLDNYAETRKVDIMVVDKDSKPVEGATVKFKVYNYAEFYPIATTQTDKDGNTSILSGMGDILVWANKGEMYGYIKSKPQDKEKIVVKLEHMPGEAYAETIVMNPPAEQPIKELSAEKIKQNAVRLAHEDSIRNAYMGTFINEKEARSFAMENKLDPDKTWHYLNLAQGNWEEVKSFMAANVKSNALFPYLASLTEKDLRDTPCNYLEDHFSYVSNIKGKDVDFYAKYVLSPRIGRELIRPWRSFFKRDITPDLASVVQSKASLVVDYVRNNIKVDDEQNYFKCPLSPQGSFELKKTDSNSRNILFVALCRSLGIPSRIETSTGRPQYFENSKWVDVFFEEQAKALPKASVMFDNDKENIVKPAYSTHYSIARYEDGDFQTLDFWGKNEYPYKVTVDAGYYRLMIGSRANDGSVTITTEYFSVNENETKKLKIVLPKNEGKIQVQGIVDMNTKVTLKDGTEKTLKELSNGKGMMICFSDPDKEPTKHILQDLPAVQKQLEQWGGGILFSIPDDKLSKAFDASVFKNLPQQSVWGVDENRTFLKSVSGALQIDFSNNFPLVVYLNSNGGILYSSQGYRIGIGENVVQTIEEEKASLKK